jgi:glycosyltransferase involved in cell wall biosynthesis
MATCQALARRGHDVTLVTRPDSSSVPRDPFEFYGLPRVNGLRFHHVPAAPGGRAGRIRFLLASLRRSRAGPAHVIYTRDLGLADFLLQRPAGRRRPVVYEAHGVAAVVGAEMPALLGKPELAPSPQKLHRLDRRERRVWRRAAACVAITSALAGELAARHGARERVFVVPDGAAPHPDGAGREGPGAPGPTRAGSPVAAYAGHLYPWKGVDVFVRALALVPGVEGLIVGGHPAESDLARVRALVDELRLAGRVTITGLVPPGEVAGRLEAATILVLPNTASALSERYTSPLKLFEYLALGRPIVASDLPAIREVLTDGQTALLVPPGDPAALAAALSRLAAEPATADSIAQRARDLAHEYTWDARARRLEAVLEAAL